MKRSGSARVTEPRALTGSISLFLNIFWGCCSYFVALMPKVSDPTFLNEFRPISRLGCISKVSPKTLLIDSNWLLGLLFRIPNPLSYPTKTFLMGHRF
ncbi:hypothetical protein HanIR_Chr12g0579921 [Helianthus annuus]|nr:hypothetical protein HanIR_Chr12g0579921 [Helianthus annuus]